MKLVIGYHNKLISLFDKRIKYILKIETTKQTKRTG